jgi:hypothetical protein
MCSDNKDPTQWLLKTDGPDAALVHAGRVGCTFLAVRSDNIPEQTSFPEGINVVR